MDANRNREEDTRLISIEAIADQELRQPEMPPHIRAKLEQIRNQARPQVARIVAA